MAAITARFGRDGHLRVPACLVELDRSLQVLLLAVGHCAQMVELVDGIVDPFLPRPRQTP
jgi:hypothetical protein